MPYESYDYTVVELNGMIYVGDRGDRGDRFQCYNPNRDSWSIKASLPVGKLNLAKSENLIYAIESNWTVHQYDTNRNIWTTVHFYIFTEARRKIRLRIVSTF